MSPFLRGRLSLCLVVMLAFCPSIVHGAGRFSFPPEWGPQEAVWLEWIETPGPQSLQAEMISAMAPHVRIRLLVESDSVRALAEDSLGARGVDLDRVEFFMNDLPSFWVRDPGPRFLSDGRNLAIADLGWNHYGYPESMILDDMQDGTLDEEIAAQLGLPLVSTPVVAEGGAIEASTSCLLSYADVAQARNPGLSLEEIEAEYLRVYGKDRMIWLDHCPPSDLVKEGAMVDDYYGFGANGHIDEFVRFVNDSTLVIAQVDSIESLSDPVSRADFLVLRENLAQLRTVRRSDGRPFHIVILPVPALTHYMWTFEIEERHRQSPLFKAMFAERANGEEIHMVPAASYLNFFITNGLVLVPAYWREGLPESEREKDLYVQRVLSMLFPGREIVTFETLTINRWGGGMHCITQQQPAVGG